MITIIDYRIGNLFSVKNALDFLGIPAQISSSPDAIINANALILPGVGAFRDGIRNLKKLGLIELLNNQVLHKKKPILGLCLGLQLMADESYEDGKHRGLGWVKGKVIKFPPNNQYRVPHIGWNDVRIVRKDALTVSFVTTPVFYFVHSYYLKPVDVGVTTGVCDHGISFLATFSLGNIYGAQFHPEKSQRDGLILLKNFGDLLHS